MNQIRSFLKITIRSAKRNPFNFLINVLGLSLGFTALFLISGYVAHEKSYDSFHQDHDRIFRLTDSWGGPGNYSRPAILPQAWANIIADQFPEISDYTRVDKRLRFNPLLAYNDIKSFESGFIEVDSTFFDVFSYKLLLGDPATALDAPNAIILTKSKAQKYFGDENPIGKAMMLDDETPLMVTGVLEDIPSNSHMDFNFIRPIVTLPVFLWVYSYFKLGPGTDVTQLQNKVQPFLRNNFQEIYKSQEYQPQFQQLSEIHLNSNLTYEFKNNGDSDALSLLIAIAFIILLLASINYVNLSSAMTLSRAKEFGVRKTFGATKNMLLRQSLSESLSIALSAFFLALLLSYFLTPVFSEISGKVLNVDFLVSHIFEYFILAIFVGLLSGFYPAFILSGLRPKETLSGNFKTGHRGKGLRKALVVVQFSVAYILIFGTAVILRQLNLFKTMDMGFEREQVLTLNGRNVDLENQGDLIRNQLTSIPGVESVGYSQTVPGDYSNMASISFNFEGQMDERFGARTIFVDEGFIETLGITMAEGRNFSKDFQTDSAAFIINETAMKNLGWESAVGKNARMTIGDQLEGRIIGVMKDFNFASLHSEIGPLVLVPFPRALQKIIIRIDAQQDVADLLSKMEREWSSLYPGQPFDHQFMDQDFLALYQEDQRFSTIIKSFTGIAILLACVGLYGMIIFEVKSRTREIGTRKVLGASTLQISLLFNSRILILLSFSVLLGIPISYFITGEWLNNFAYAINPGVDIYLIALVILIFISLLTTVTRVYRATLINPAKVLKDE